MFGWLRRRETLEEIPSQEEREEEATAEVLSHIEMINDCIPRLPFGTLPWMDWSERPPRLKLKKRRFDSDEIIEFHTTRSGRSKSRG